jgi:hypothetical protein
LHGFANITVMRDPADGRLLLIEMDLRPNALFHLGEALGVGIFASLREILEGGPPGPVRQLSSRLDVEVPVYPGDVIRCVLERDWRGLAAWTFNHDDRWRWAPRGDPALAWAYRKYIVGQIVHHRRAARRKDDRARTELTAAGITPAPANRRRRPPRPPA